VTRLPDSPYQPVVQVLKTQQICGLREFFIELLQNFLLFLHRGGPGRASSFKFVSRESVGAFACVGVQTGALKLLRVLVKYSALLRRTRRGSLLGGIQHNCHPFLGCQRASAVSLVHPVPVGEVSLPLLPQMTMLTKVPDNAKGSGVACDVDSQLLLRDLMLLVLCHQKTLRYLKHLKASNFCTTDEKKRKICMCLLSPIYNSALTMVL